ncbi:response regulator [bacterium]|nr:response regulator [bacterium]HPF34245.1 response regulator [Candidatus Krumholzibacteria bacterium]HRX49976.1 response regulator [Candidatus Krumholzibacteria bacterium]
MTDIPARILLVDDEPMILSSLRTFLELETDHEVITFTEPQKALDADPDADVVISDYLMPGLDGISFLARYKERRPHVPRILLTGYADKENAIRAINEVGLFQYIEKPWDNDNLLLVLRNALERRRLLEALDTKVAEINAAYGQLRGLQDDILKTFL